ncbi:hypothetical protein [Lysobacter sp. GCM10012299]|uniref:hypothetical protein n=1 Tax=Lysobacter sp. GCM10012299 TaxID=3317333 RepID=UPI00362408A0
MGSTELTLDEASGLWVSADGHRYVRNEFDPDHPVMVDVTGSCWTVTYGGLNHSLDWNSLGLPEPLLEPLQQVLIARLRRSAPSSLSPWRLTLTVLARCASHFQIPLTPDLSSIGASQWLRIWQTMKVGYRTWLREIYRELADRRLAGARQDIVLEMRSWKARHELVHMQNVLDWNQESGPLISAEMEVLRGELAQSAQDEPMGDWITRLFAQVCQETLKRSEQLLSMRCDALKVFHPKAQGHPAEYFVEVPGAKAQTGTQRLWPVSERLGLDLVRYCECDDIRILQVRHDRFFVIPGEDGERAWEAYGQVSSALMGVRVHDWARKRRIRSPRTGRLLNLRPKRLRHSGATAMALQGVPREVIQDTLEHDSPISADAYIKAVGAELLPVVERASDRGIGKVFEAISGRYFFKGEIRDKVERRPIHIPIALKNPAPAVVGSCGTEGSCAKHPFWACYNGCPNFLAWREADHGAALAFVQAELDRWSLAEGGKERSKLFKDFERIATAIQEVIDQIRETGAEGTI